jgi:hypothetical protein
MKDAPKTIKIEDKLGNINGGFQTNFGKLLDHYPEYNLESFNKIIELWKIDSQYSIQVLNETLNRRLIALKAEIREILSKKLSHELVEMSRIVSEERMHGEQALDKTGSWINNIDTEAFKTETVEVYENMIDTFYSERDLIFMKYKDLLDLIFIKL